MILNVLEGITGLSKIKINTADIDKLVKSYKNLNIEKAVAKMRTDGVADAEIRATLASQHYTQADIQQAMATKATNVAKTQNITLTKLQTAGHYALATAAKVAKIALGAFAGILISITGFYIDKNNNIVMSNTISESNGFSSSRIGTSDSIYCTWYTKYSIIYYNKKSNILEKTGTGTRGNTNIPIIPYKDQNVFEVTSSSGKITFNKTEFS